MNVYYPHFVEELKKCVMATAGFINIAPCDCRTIAALITLKTKHQVSETTIKRIYGFAYSKFKPSLYTIDAMAAYCGYQGWTDFYTKQKNDHANTGNPAWESLKNQAEKFTNFTQQALKNRSGIPYHLTIKRRFLDEHMDAFLSDDKYTATIISAPAGYGKTLALCHWIDERLDLNAQNSDGDIILFFSSSAMINLFLSGRDINEWLLGLMGYSSDNEIASLVNEKKNTRSRFLLIIDGLDEHSFKTDLFKNMIDQLINILALYQDYKWFKLVITMRAASWINCRHEFENGVHECFLGYVSEEDPAANVPLFSLSEIKQLSYRINPEATVPADVDVITKFSHPLYFQYYYKNHKDHFALNLVDRVCIYELISNFILNKVYLGNNSAEKVMFLSGLTELMDIKNSVYHVSKIKANALIKQHHHAYRDLIAIGFIREVNNSNELVYHVNIQFTNNDFLEYTIAKKLLLDNNYKFDTALVEKINYLFEEDDDIKLHILKWTIIYLIKSDQLNSLKYVAGVKFSVPQKVRLVSFLAELLEKECIGQAGSGSARAYIQQNCVKDLFDYFVEPQFIEPPYEKTLIILSRFDLTPPQRMTVYLSLSLIAIIQLDMPKLEKHISAIKNLNDKNAAMLFINPVSCLDFVYQFLRYGIVNHQFLKELTRFSFSTPGTRRLAFTSADNIMCMLTGYASLLSTNTFKTLRFIKRLENEPGYDTAVPPYIRFFIEALKVDRYAVLNRIDTANKLYKKLVKNTIADASNATPAIAILLEMEKTKMATINKHLGEQQEALNKFKNLTEDTVYCLPQIMLYHFLLYGQPDNDLLNNHEKELQYKLLRCLRRCGINESAFLGAVLN